jgi:hypothetical protein
MNLLAHRILSKNKELFTNIDQTIITALPHILSCLYGKVHTFRELKGYNGDKVYGWLFLDGKQKNWS